MGVSGATPQPVPNSYANPLLDPTLVPDQQVCVPPELQVCEGAYAPDHAAVAAQKAVVPAKPLALVETFSLAKFVSPLQSGDKLDIDGPGWMNGSGRINKLTDSELSLSFKVRSVGSGSMTMKHSAGNTYNVTLVVDGSTYEFAVSMRQKGSKVIFAGVEDPSQKLVFSMKGGKLTIDPDGMKFPGTFDITKE